MRKARAKAASMLRKARIAITPRERREIEVADLGLGELGNTGIEIVLYANNDRYCAKELILFPRQTCPQHRHPPIRGHPGKMETFRCRWGVIHLYIPGKPAQKTAAKPPKGREKYYTVWREIRLGPGKQYTIPPNTWHWFQAGPRGAIVSEFSSTSRDGSDIFTDPGIRRNPRKG